MIPARFFRSFAAAGIARAMCHPPLKTLHHPSKHNVPLHFSVFFYHDASFSLALSLSHTHTFVLFRSLLLSFPRRRDLRGTDRDGRDHSEGPRPPPLSERENLLRKALAAGWWLMADGCDSRACQERQKHRHPRKPNTQNRAPLMCLFGQPAPEVRLVARGKWDGNEWAWVVSAAPTAAAVWAVRG